MLKHVVDRADLEAIAQEALIERRQRESGIEGLWHTCIDSMRQLQRYYRTQRRKHPHELTLLVYVVVLISGPVLALHCCRKQGQPNTPTLRVLGNPLAAPNVLDPFRMPGPGWDMAVPVDTAANDRTSDRMLQKQFEQVTEGFRVARRETGLNQTTDPECAICLGYLRYAWLQHVDISRSNVWCVGVVFHRLLNLAIATQIPVQTKPLTNRGQLKSDVCVCVAVMTC